MTQLIHRIAALSLLAAASLAGLALASPTEPSALTPAPDPARSAAATQVTPGPVAEELTPDLRRIQQNLGGPVINQFPSLDNQSPNPSPSSGPPPTATYDPNAIQPSLPVQPSLQARAQRPSSVQILREVAAQLEQAANRLEDLDLYRQADGLREQAQRLRVDARTLAGANNNDGRTISPAPPWTTPSTVPTPTPAARLRYGADPPRRRSIRPNEPLPSTSGPVATTPADDVEPQPSNPPTASAPKEAERQ